MTPAPDWASLLHEVGISSSDLYHQIIGAVTRGSGDAVLAWDDFEFMVSSTYEITGTETALELMAGGMAPLDAIVWVNGQNKPDGLSIEQAPAGECAAMSASDIYSGFFAWYFSLYSQGRSIGQGSPNFLTSVLNLGPDWSDLITGLSSADIDHFPTEWVKNVSLTDLGDKSRNRLALGAAGHRYLACLKFIRPDDFLPGSAAGQAFITGIRSWTSDRVWWDLHPITKSGNVITVTGSINKLIEDCLAASVSPERLATLTQSRILHHVPQLIPTHSNWANFDMNLLPNLSQPIF
jgi:hypothetical protein